mgnify:CR=1 FL=1
MVAEQIKPLLSPLFILTKEQKSDRLYSCNYIVKGLVN